jgi:hypothetical protein
LIYPQIKSGSAPKKQQNEDQPTRAETAEIKSRKPENYNNTNFNMLVNETKLNDLETKLLGLEQQNTFLIEKLKNNEKNFEVQLSRIAMSTEGERESRYRIEKFINMLNEQVWFKLTRIQ